MEVGPGQRGWRRCGTVSATRGAGKGLGFRGAGSEDWAGAGLTCRVGRGLVVAQGAQRAVGGAERGAGRPGRGEGGPERAVLEASGLAAGAEVAVGGRLHGRHAGVVRIEVGVVHRPGGARTGAGPGQVGVGVPGRVRVGMGVRGLGAEHPSPAPNAREPARPVAAALRPGAAPVPPRSARVPFNAQDPAAGAGRAPRGRGLDGPDPAPGPPTPPPPPKVPAAGCGLRRLRAGRREAGSPGAPLPPPARPDLRSERSGPVQKVPTPFPGFPTCGPAGGRGGGPAALV